MAKKLNDKGVVPRKKGVKRVLREVSGALRKGV